LMDRVDADFAPILRYFKINRSRLSDELNRSLEGVKTGNDRTPVFSPPLLKMLTQAWSLASINYGYTEIRTSMTILALLTEPELLQMVRSASRVLTLINPETLATHLVDLTADSVEGRQISTSRAAGIPEEGPAPNGKTPFLDQYTTHLTDNARRGK